MESSFKGTVKVFMGLGKIRIKFSLSSLEPRSEFRTTGQGINPQKL